MVVDRNTASYRIPIIWYSAIRSQNGLVGQQETGTQRDLLHEPVWLPYETVHLDFREPGPIGSGCFVASSNGLSSGNHLLEAISHGICEAVERDATSLWNQADAQTQYKTCIDLGSIVDPDCCAVIGKFTRADVTSAVWETTKEMLLNGITRTIEIHDFLLDRFKTRPWK